MTGKEDYTFIDKVFVRTPFYSFSSFGLEKLPLMLGDALFRNALWLASPVFYGLLEKKAFGFSRLSEKERFTLAKYYNRMCFRPTPFGLFACFSLAPWSVKAGLSLSGDPGVRLHLRPDQEWLRRMNGGDDGLPGEAQVALNPTVVQIGGRFRFVSGHIGADGRQVYSVSAVGAGKLHVRLVKALAGGPLTLAGVIHQIGKLTDCTEAEAADYAAFLAASQFLCTAGRRDLAEPVMPPAGQASFWRRVATRLTGDVGSLASDEFEVRAQAPEAAAAGRSVFYAAAERSAVAGGADTADRKHLSGALVALQALALPYRSADLGRFIADFKQRYDREAVPLLEALDPDTGLAYGDVRTEGASRGLLEDVMFPRLDRETAKGEWTAVHRLLFRNWAAIKGKGHFALLELTDIELAELPRTDGGGALAPSMALLYTPTEAGLVIEEAGGASAVALTGRFGTFSNEAFDLCREIAEREAEANPGIVFADLWLNGDDHVDNINRRRPVYEYGIPLNVFSSLQADRQLLPADLILLVRSDELILESRRLKKRIIPRLSTAYNFNHSQLPLFRLLCDLQFQGLQASLGFDLAAFFPGQEFYPRVVYKGVILGLARWHLSAAEIRQLTALPPSLGRFHQFRQERGIPMSVCTGRGDQQLVFNFVRDGETRFFLDHLKGSENVVLKEYLYPSGGVSAEGRPFAAQQVAMLYKTSPVYAEMVARENGEKAARRTFLPGSEWLYLKLYCTPQSADELLSSVISPVLLQNRALVSRWFFIRYVDPGYHLRIRILMPPAQQGKLLESLERRLSLKKYRHLVGRLQGDTYRRELERYGAGIIGQIEGLFEADSDLVLVFLADAGAGDRSGDTGLAAFVFSWQLAETLLPDPLERSGLFAAMSDSFLGQFKQDKALKLSMDRKYRALAAELDTLLGPPDGGRLSAPVRRALKVLLDQADALYSVTACWPAQRRQALAADLLHMQVNRFFTVAQTNHEALMYYFFVKYIAARAGRNRRTARV